MAGFGLKCLVKPHGRFPHSFLSFQLVCDPTHDNEYLGPRSLGKDRNFQGHTHNNDNGGEELAHRIRCNELQM